MNDSQELSCFDCQLVRNISNQLEWSRSVRDETLTESIRVMNELAAVEDTGENYEELRARWQRTRAEVFALLDSADKTLNDTRIGLVETCEANRPVYEDTQDGTEGRVLGCGSVLAQYAMLAVGLKNK